METCFIKVVKQWSTNYIKICVYYYYEMGSVDSMPLFHLREQKVTEDAWLYVDLLFILAFSSKKMAHYAKWIESQSLDVKKRY